MKRKIKLSKKEVSLLKDKNLNITENGYLIIDSKDSPTQIQYIDACVEECDKALGKHTACYEKALVDRLNAVLAYFVRNKRKKQKK